MDPDLSRNVSGTDAGSRSTGGPGSQWGTGGNSSDTQIVLSSGGGKKTRDDARGLRCKAFCKEKDPGNNELNFRNFEKKNAKNSQKIGNIKN